MGREFAWKPLGDGAKPQATSKAREKKRADVAPVATTRRTGNRRSATANPQSATAFRPCGRVRVRSSRPQPASNPMPSK